MDSVTNIFLWNPFITTILSQSRGILSIVKNNWNGNFSDFIDLQQKKTSL